MVCLERHRVVSAESVERRLYHGSPLVEKATLRLDPKFYKGGSFTVIAHNASKQNCYIQSAKLNGKPLNRPWLTQADIVNGGKLELEMDLLPNKAWGTDLQP